VARISASLKRLVFETDLGWMGLLVSDRGVRKLVFDQPSAARARTAVTRGLREPCQDSDEELPVVCLLADYAAGRPVDLAGVSLDLATTTAFAARVVSHCRRIPFGETLSYGELAERAGSPGAARAVGNIMKSNAVPLLVPCHRVVAAGGKLGGYSASGGVSVKQRLLALEAGRASAPPGRKKPRKQTVSVC
jgi:methylated-DNA-[protein]-cysteine S-methyltransferase